MLRAGDGLLDEELHRNRPSKNPMSIHDYLGDSLGIVYYFRIPPTITGRGVFSGCMSHPVTIRAVDRPIPKGYKGHPNDPVPVDQVRCFGHLKER